MPKCPKHKGSDIVMICTSCKNDFVCLECVAETHRGHVVLRFDDVRKDLHQRLKDSGQIISNLRSDILNASVARKEQDDLCEDVNAKINEQREALHKIVDELSDNLLAVCKKQKDRNCLMLKEQEHMMTNQIPEEEIFSEKLRIILKIKDSVDLIQKYKDLQKPNLKRYAKPYMMPMKFKGGMINAAQVKKMLGRMVGETVDNDKPDFIENRNGQYEHDSPNASPEFIGYTRVKSRFETPMLSPVHFGHYSRTARPRETPRLSPDYGTVKTLRGMDFAPDYSIIRNLKGMETPRNHMYTVGSPMGSPYGADMALSMLHTFRHSSIGVSFICPSSPGHSWLKCYNQREIRLTNKAGSIKYTVNFDTKIGGLTTTPDNRVLVCCFNAHCIKQIAVPSYKVSTVFNTAPLKPNYICATVDGDIFLTLIDRPQYEVTPESQRLVVRYTKNYQEMARAQFDKFGKHIFVLPCQVRVNFSGNTVAVTNETGESSAHIVLLDSMFNMKLRYLGDGRVSSPDRKFGKSKNGGKFYVNDVDFDSKDNIILAESHTRSIQLLDPTCQLLRILVQENNIPWSISVNNNGEMWVGLDNGRVNIYR